MDLQRDIKSVTYMKTHPAELIETVTKNHRPMVITQNGEAKVIVQDIASYEKTRKALLLLKLLAQSESDIRQGKTVPQAEVFERLEKKFKKQ